VWITLELLSVGADLIPVMPLRRITAPRGLGLEPPSEPGRDPSIGDSSDVDNLILERDWRSSSPVPVAASINS